MERENFIFYASFDEMIQKLPNVEDRERMYHTICNYALRGEEPDFSDNWTLDALFSAIFQILHKQRTNFLNGMKGKEFGKKGGAPKGNQNARKKQLKTTEKQPKTTVDFEVVLKNNETQDVTDKNNPQTTRYNDKENDSMIIDKDKENDSIVFEENSSILRACETAEQSEQSLSKSLNCSSISIAEELKEAKLDFREYRKERFAKWAIILQNHNEATADENMKAYLASGAIEERFDKFKSYVPTIIEEQKAEVYEGWEKYKTSVLRKQQQPKVPTGKKLTDEEKEQLSSLYRDVLASFMGRGMSATEAVSKVFCLGDETRTDAEEFVETLDIQVTPQEQSIHSPQTVSLADDAFDEDEEVDERFLKWLQY